MISSLLLLCNLTLLGFISWRFSPLWITLAVTRSNFSVFLFFLHFIFILRSFKNENINREWMGNSLENRHQRQFNLWHICKGLKATFAALHVVFNTSAVERESQVMWSINTQTAARVMGRQLSSCVPLMMRNPFESNFPLDRWVIKCLRWMHVCADTTISRNPFTFSITSVVIPQSGKTQRSHPTTPRWKTTKTKFFTNASQIPLNYPPNVSVI